MKITYEASTVSANVSSVNVGSVYECNSGTSNELVLTNSASESVNVTLSATGPFSVASSATVSANSTATVPVTYTPTAAGEQTGTLTMTANGSTIGTVALTGTGVSATDVVTINGTPLAFGEAVIGVDTSNDGIFLKNSSANTFTATATISGDGFSLGNTSFSVPASPTNNGEVSIPVTFKPADAITYTGDLTLTFVWSTLTASMTGTGVDQPVDYAARVTPTSLDFGTVYTGLETMPTQEVTLYNSGNKTITPILGRTNAAFTVTGESGALASKASRVYTITFTPTDDGTFSDNLNITASESTDISLSVSLTGVGTTDESLGIKVTPTSLDFGSVNSGSPATRSFTVSNSGSATTATITVDAPYTVTNNNVTIANGNNTIEVTFTPTDASSHTQNLTLTIGGNAYTVNLTGIGVDDTQLATRDSVFFKNITYNWTDSNGDSHTNNLTEVATDPDQMIAMLTEVYTNQNIPGNWYNGYTSDLQPAAEVYYPAVGPVQRSKSGWVYTYGYDVDNTGYGGWGWNIPPKTDLLSVSTSTYTYKYFNPNDYKPYQDGVTLLLVELKDGATSSDLTTTTSYETLRSVFNKMFKSIRVVTNSRIAGADTTTSTVFSINCENMNRFFMLAKGRQRRLDVGTTQVGSNTVFGCEYAYKYKTSDEGSSSSSSIYQPGDADGGTYNPFYCMFEQFSPTDQSSSVENTDLLLKLSAGETFPVLHDCIAVMYIDGGHQFDLYGSDATSEGKKDIYGLLFTVPKYRMKYWYVNGFKEYSRDAYNTEYYNKYSTDMFQSYYNSELMGDKFEYRPTMGLFSIYQWPITGERVGTTNWYELDLSWYSNILNLLPNGGTYKIYQVVDGNYVPVYYTDATGNYVDADGNAVTEPVQVTVDATKYMSDSPSATDSNNETFSPVYVPMYEHGYTVTYVIQAEDEDGWLPVQTSNSQSFVIPGWNVSEKLRLTLGDDYTSRFEPEAEYNYYSNGLEVENYSDGVLGTQLSTSLTDQFQFYRAAKISQSDATTGEVTTVAGDTVLIAKASVTAAGTLTINMVSDTQVEQTDFPTGKEGTSGYYAGYHSNPTTVTYTVGSDGYVTFNDFKIYDNFRASTASNAHPTEYDYYLTLTTAEPFAIDNDGNESNLAYSNEVPVAIPHTNMDVAGTLTLGEVIRDGKYDPRSELSTDMQFDVDVTYSPLTDVKRYGIYRWSLDDTRYVINNVDSDGETNVAPSGSADNQVSSYTVSMNGTQQSVVSIAQGETKAATFSDDVPTQSSDQYIYAPVVEKFNGNIQEYSYYNTYGAPLKSVVTGTLAVQVDPTVNTASNPLMSEYKWYDGGVAYSYYDIPVKFTALDVPEGYELYKVRAWRLVDNAASVLGEELATRSVRVSSDYLYEDIDYGTDLENDYGTMCLKNIYSSSAGYLMGSRSVNTAWFDNGTEETDVEGHIEGETHATFGAQRLATDDDSSGTLDEISGTFVVRAYYTKIANPAIGGATGNAPIYVIGNQENSTTWDPSTELTTLYSNDGTNFYGSLVVNNTNDGSDDGYGFFSLTTQLSESASDWTSIADYRYGWNDGNYWVTNDTYGNAVSLYKSTDPGAFRIPVGTYQLKVTASNGAPQSIVITRGGLVNAPRRATALTPADYNYYVAEGTTTFSFKSTDEIITGVTSPVVDRTHEVQSVTYVNPMGQVSDRPFSGVNIIVTRYTDGTTTSCKVIK